MTKNQFEKLMEYIDARCEYIVSQQLGRDALNESIRSSTARSALAAVLDLPSWI